MLVCQWHLDIIYGKQAEAVRVMRAWGVENLPVRSSVAHAAPGFWRDWWVLPPLA